MYNTGIARYLKCIDLFIILYFKEFLNAIGMLVDKNDHSLKMLTQQKGFHLELD